MSGELKPTPEHAFVAIRAIRALLVDEDEGEWREDVSGADVVDEVTQILADSGFGPDSAGLSGSVPRSRANLMDLAIKSSIFQDVLRVMQLAEETLGPEEYLRLMRGIAQETSQRVYNYVSLRGKPNGSTER